MERWIEHLVEPRRLILAWQPPLQAQDRTRWAVGELHRDAEGTAFRYFAGREFQDINADRPIAALVKAGFLGYPAFRWALTDTQTFREGALEAFLRRVPSQRREDFPQYLRRFHLRPRPELSGFALLGVTGASLPNDGFSLVDPLDPEARLQDVILEVNGYRHYTGKIRPVEVGAAVQLIPEPTNRFDQFAVRVETEGELIGYVNRLQSPTVSRWIGAQSVEGWIARLNGSTSHPRAFIFVQMRARALRPAA